MEIEGVNAKANAGLSLGIIGTALSVLSGGMGLFNVHSGNVGSGNAYVTKDELNYVQQLAAKDSQIALLTSEQNTEIKIADVYARLKADMLTLERNQSDWNASQSVVNARMSSAIEKNRNSISALENTCDRLTKVVIPIRNVCPEPMPRYNSWTAPTTTEETPTA